MSKQQESDEQGFIVTLGEDNVLTVIDSMGGGERQGIILDPDQAERLVAAYIRELAPFMAEALVGQLDWDDESDGES